MSNERSPFRWGIVALLFLVILFMQMTYSCLPPLFSEINRDIPLSKAQMGMVFGMVPLASVFFSLPGGVICDKFGPRLTIGLGILIAVVFGGLRSFASSAIELASLTFAVGAGLAIVVPNIPKVAAEWFSQNELGKVNGIIMSAASIGIGLGLGTGSSLLSPAFGGWKGVMVFTAAMCLLIAVVWMLVYRKPKPSPISGAEEPHATGDFKDVFTMRDIWLIAVFCGCFYFTIGSLMGLLPIVLEERGIGQAGELASLLILAGVLSSPLGGMLSDKVGRRKPFLIVPAMVVGVCIPFFIILTGILLVAAIVIAGLAQGIIFPIMLATLIEIKRVGVSYIATAAGLVFTVGSVFGFFGPVVSGKLMESSGSSWSAFLLMAAVLIVAGGVVIPLERGAKA